MKPSRDVVFATYNVLPHGDPDDLLALALLEKKGLNVAVVDWRAVAPAELDSRLLVLRTTWDYHHYCHQFLDWVDVAATHAILKNGPALVRWNANKKYLLDLERCDLAIVPTFFIERSRAKAIDTGALAAILSSAMLKGSAQIVVKPSIGLSTYGVKRFDLEQTKIEDICGHVALLAEASDVLIQPYLEAVEKYGERSLVFLDNRFSHAVRKAAFQKIAISGEAGETCATASAAEISFGQKVLSKLEHIDGLESPLYARVDVVPDDSGQLMLLELELIEPSLFLAMDAGAPSRFADAIAAVLS